jgi:hypothetical protein
MFHRLLALNSGANVVVRLEIDETSEAVLFRKAVDQRMPMLIAAANKIIGDTDVKNAVTPIGHYINEAARHIEI